MEPTPGGQLADIYEGMTDPLLSMVARLAKGPIGQPNQTIVLADLVEADFPGYAAVPLVADLENAFETDGYGELSPQRVIFNVGTLVTPQQLTHIYVTKTYDGGGLSLVMAVPFTTPILLQESDVTLDFDVGVAGVISPDA
jgi:hypothetical protein